MIHSKISYDVVRNSLRNSNFNAGFPPKQREIDGTHGATTSRVKCKLSKSALIDCIVPVFAPAPQSMLRFYSILWDSVGFYRIL